MQENDELRGNIALLEAITAEHVAQLAAQQATITALKIFVEQKLGKSVNPIHSASTLGVTDASASQSQETADIDMVSATPAPRSVPGPAQDCAVSPELPQPPRTEPAVQTNAQKTSQSPLARTSDLSANRPADTAVEGVPAMTEAIPSSTLAPNSSTESASPAESTANLVGMGIEAEAHAPQSGSERGQSLDVEVSIGKHPTVLCGYIPADIAVPLQDLCRSLRDQSKKGCANQTRLT